MTRVVITGATGTIGSSLCRALIARGDQVVALSRDQQRAQAALPDGVESHTWDDPTVQRPPAAARYGAKGVLHLVGEPVAQRWSETAKTKIRHSRVRSTRMLVAVLRELPERRRPEALVSQSATGFYGPSDDRVLDEESPQGSGRGRVGVAGDCRGSRARGRRTDRQGAREIEEPGLV